MFVKSTLEVPAPTDQVAPPILDSPSHWLRPLLVVSRAQSRLLRAEVGVDLSPRFGRVRLEVHTPTTYKDATFLPFHVHVEDAEEWATFDNVLTAAWLGDWRTQLALEGCYPHTNWMTPRDQSLLHRVVEAVTRQLLTAVAVELTERRNGASFLECAVRPSQPAPAAGTTRPQWPGKP
jgi:hypothetical protein